MSADPESALLPLRARAADMELLRTAGARPAPVVRIASAVDATLRRVLRDDPTAAVELRLAALSPEDLGSADLLAELRRRERIPVELAAGVHDLLHLAERIAAGADPDEVEAALALTVAERVESHIRASRGEVHLLDPVSPRPAAAPGEPPRDGAPRAVPGERSRRIPWATFAVLAGIVLLLVLAIRMRSGNDALRQGESAYRAGRVVEAERLFRVAMEHDPRDPFPRVYLARILREAGRNSDAEAVVVGGIRTAPGSAELHVERGFLLLDDGRAAEAVPVFREALRHDRDSRRGWAGLVRALRDAGRADDAEQVLRLAPAELRALMRTAVERAPER
jgi:tetratricopeptide (TPR) repeat protein